MGIPLKMQTAQRSGFGNGKVFLDKFERNIGVAIQHALPPRFPEHTAIIPKLTGRQLHQSTQMQRCYFHLNWGSR
jgi:hypothetical protein